jgi:cell division protein FtsB
MRMGRKEMLIRLVLIAALLYFVYWTVFTNAGLGR